MADLTKAQLQKLVADLQQEIADLKAATSSTESEGMDFEKLFLHFKKTFSPTMDLFTKESFVDACVKHLENEKEELALQSVAEKAGYGSHAEKLAADADADATKEKSPKGHALNYENAAAKKLADHYAHTHGGYPTFGHLVDFLEELKVSDSAAVEKELESIDQFLQKFKA